jgi:tRNA(Ile)-lysidine synthase
MSRRAVPPPSASDPFAVAAERFHHDLNRALGAELRGAILLAVSGGPDSMAMLTLAAATFPGRIRVATVDHRLRAAAAAEAEMVANHCALLHVPHATLIPDAPITGASIQAAARQVRYRLLADHARGVGAETIATAHHADDQAETFLMRAARRGAVRRRSHQHRSGARSHPLPPPARRQ